EQPDLRQGSAQLMGDRRHEVGAHGGESALAAGENDRGGEESGGEQKRREDERQPRRGNASENQLLNSGRRDRRLERHPVEDAFAEAGQSLFHAVDRIQRVSSSKQDAAPRV